MDPELKEFNIQDLDGIADVMKLNPKSGEGDDDDDYDGGGGDNDDHDDDDDNADAGDGGGLVGGGGVRWNRRSDDVSDDDDEGDLNFDGDGDGDGDSDAVDAVDAGDGHEGGEEDEEDEEGEGGEGDQEDEEDEEEEDEDEDDDIEDVDDTNKFKKFNQSLRANYITETHPESASHNDDEIHSLAHVVRDQTGAIIDPLHRTVPILTKYEKTRILGVRTKQINEGAPPYISVKSTIIDGYIIAMRELEEKKIPFIVRRPLPNGGSEYWYLQDLEII